MEPTQAPTFVPIRPPDLHVVQGLLPPPNPLPHELLVLWAEAGSAELHCVLRAHNMLPVRRFVPFAVQTLRCAAACSSCGVESPRSKHEKLFFCESSAAADMPSDEWPGALVTLVSH